MPGSVTLDRTDFDSDLYELNLAIFRWDPSVHPRDVFGKFKTVLMKMGKGDEVEIPGGIRVRKLTTGDDFVMFTPGGGERKVKGPVNVAQWALRRAGRRGQSFKQVGFA